MAGLSIQLNRFCIGSHCLESQKILPAHKQILEKSLVKIFSDAVEKKEAAQEIPFHIQIKPSGDPALSIQGKEIPLAGSPEAKKIGRIFRYYQHVGLLPRKRTSESETVYRENESRKWVQAVNQASIPGSNGNILAGMRVADDTLSLVRNVLFALPAIGPRDPVVSHLGYYAGIFWSFFSFRELDGGIIEYKRSNLIQDAEGQRRAEARILSGSILSAGSVSYLAGKISETFISASAASFLGSLSNVLFGTGALIAIGSAGLGAMRCERFNKRLTEYLENPNLSEEERLKGALNFLKDSIVVTEEEKGELIAQIEKEHPDWSKEQKNQLLNQKMTDLTEVKVKYMKRRTSNKSLYLILTQVDPLLAKLSNPETAEEAIKEALILIHTIQGQNRIKLSLYLLGLVAAVISFVGMLLMSLLSAGAIPFVFYSVAGLIYLSMTLYSSSGVFFRKEIKPPKAIGIIVQ